MLVTLLGIVIEVRPLQSQKAFAPIDVTLFGIVTEVRLLQSEKASSPIDVTLSGIVKEVRLLQSEYLQPVVYQHVLIKTIEKCFRRFY